MKVIITIPAYNEERTISRVIDEIKDVMTKTSYNYKILVLDDGSTDNTVIMAKKSGALVFSNRRNKGLAETFREEMRQCIKLKADIIVHTDADGQYPAEFIPKLINKVERGYDLVLGSRFRGKIQYMPWMKKIGNYLFAFVLSHLTRKKITDSTTGFRAFTKEVAQDIKYINTFTYTQEQIIKASKQGLKIAEVPIYARKTRDSRLFKHPIQYAIKAWLNIFRIYRDFEPLKFFGQIGLFFFILGFTIGAWLLYRFFTLGYVGRTPSTLLSMLLILMGVQIIFFGFLADMLKK
jgi:glycosyltransferase involved in cell wall biosynthesis